MTEPKNTLKADVYWAAVPEWLLDTDVSDRAIRVYAWLARRAGQTGKAMPSRKWLADRCHCSPTSIDRATLELVDVGAVTRERRYTDEGDLDTTEYTVHILPQPTTGEDHEHTPQGGPDDGDPSSPVERGTRTGEGTGTRTGGETVHAPVVAYREPPYREPLTDTSLRSVSARTGDDDSTGVDTPEWVSTAGAVPLMATGIRIGPGGPDSRLWTPLAQRHAWMATDDAIAMGFPVRRDLLWEAADAEFGTPANDRERSRRSKAVKDLREAGVDPLEVKTLATAYRLQFSAACTDMAVAGRVGELRHLAANPDKLPGTNKTDRALVEDTVNRQRRRAQLEAVDTTRQIGDGR